MTETENETVHLRIQFQNDPNAGRVRLKPGARAPAGSCPWRLEPAAAAFPGTLARGRMRREQPGLGYGMLVPQVAV